MVAGRLRPQLGFAEFSRLRGGIGIEGRLLHVASAGPETNTAYLVRISLAGDDVGSGTLGRAAAGKAGDRQIEAAPEKMDRTRFTQEARAELGEDAVGR